MPAVLQSNLQWVKSSAKIRLGNDYVYGGMYSPTRLGQGCDCSGIAGWGLQALTIGPQNMPLDGNGNWLHTVSTENWPFDYSTGSPAAAGTVGPYGTIAVGSDLSQIPADAACTVNIMHGGGGVDSHMNLVLADGTIVESNGNAGSCTNGTGGNPSGAGLWTDHWFLPGPVSMITPPTQFYFDVSNNQWGGPAYTDAGKQQLISFLTAAKVASNVIGGLHKVTEGASFVDPYWNDFKTWCENPVDDFSWLGYHYVTLDDPAAQAGNFVQAGGGSWAMLDFEANSGNISNMWAVTDAFNRAGVDVSMLYLPDWYWQSIGSPDLSSLTSNQMALVASNYSGDSGLVPAASYASAGGNTAPGWGAYGGCLPTCLQFTNKALLGNVLVDLNAYNGFVTDLNALFTGAIFSAN
jgi:hypothetical protein